MRTATLVLVAYLVCVVVAAVWRYVPWLADAIPDIGALTASYLGLTARRQVSPAIGGAIVLGYLIDLISGAPPGLLALVLGLTTLIARAIQQRILVRGAAISIAFSAFVALIAGVLALIIRLLYRMPSAAFTVELKHLAQVTFATAMLGPLVWRLFRRIDAAFARTHREREAALEASHHEVAMLIRQSSGPGSGNGPALPELHRRLKWVALIGIGALLMLIGRLWQLQVMRGESYYERTVSNVVKERYLPSVRGKILDRKGAALADNRPAFNIYATPKQLTRPLEAELVRMLGLSDDEIAKIDERLEVGKKRDPRTPIVILEDQGRDRAALIEQSLTRLPGVEIHHEPYRYYPQGDLAAHLIGYMTQMTAGEAERLGNQGYDASELVGRYGLEDKWENYLRGKKGIERFAVDARGQRLDDATASALIQGERGVPAVPGANLVLTIDADLQRLAEKAISHSAAAAIVVVEPKTGKLRAVVSKPSFDPNVMTGHLTQAEETMLKQDPRKPFIDKALRMTYPPGSIFKFTTAIAALEDGQAAEDENMFCTGEYQLSGTRFNCHGTHGKVDLDKAIQKSCDTYFWRLAERIGIDRIAQVATEYGLGRPTNLGLNGDAGGRIPTKDWYEKTTRYKVGYATNASIGQGDVEVTVLQMAMAYAALANGGTLYVPQVVDRLEAHDGHTITSYDPKVASRVRTPTDALDIWKRGMWKVTNEPGGTAYDHGHSDVVTVMGKTGTAEVEKHHKQQDEKDLERWNPKAAHAWFAGWAPAEDPEIVIVVLVEHGGAGGTIAWPIARQVIEGYFTKIKPAKEKR